MNSSELAVEVVAGGPRLAVLVEREAVHLARVHLDDTLEDGHLQGDLNVFDSLGEAHAALRILAARENLTILFQKHRVVREGADLDDIFEALDGRRQHNIFIGLGALAFHFVVFVAELPVQIDAPRIYYRGFSRFTFKWFHFIK